MKSKIQKIGVWLLGALIVSFSVALIIPLAIWILTYIFLGFSNLIREKIDFLYPAYIIIGISLWWKFSRDKSFRKDAFGVFDTLEKIGLFILAASIYSVSIGLIFFVIFISLNFILSLFAKDQYALLKWFYDLSENSRFALIIAVGIFTQIIFPYNMKEDNQEQ